MTLKTVKFAFSLYEFNQLYLVSAFCTIQIEHICAWNRHEIEAFSRRESVYGKI